MKKNLLKRSRLLDIFIVVLMPPSNRGQQRTYHPAIETPLLMQQCNNGEIFQRSTVRQHVIAIVRAVGATNFIASN